MEENCYVGITYKLGVMKSLMQGVIHGRLNGLIVKGSPGIGKSHHLQQLIDAAPRDKYKIERHTGKISPVMAFHALGDNCEKGCTVVFDDTDSVYEHVDSMNCLKAAVDTRQNRIVRWESTFKGMKYTQFKFDGGVIILTNSNFSSHHFSALLDRFHYLDLTVTREERIEQIVELSCSPDFDQLHASAACNWILSHLDNLGEISMRTFVKAYDLSQFDPDWRRIAHATLCNSWVL